MTTEQTAAVGGPPLLAVDHLDVRYGRRPRRSQRSDRAASTLTVADVSLTLPEGRTLGLVGESGSGKTTVCKAIAGLVAPAGGSIRFLGNELVGIGARRRRRVTRGMQMVFQDPFGSLDPRARIGDIIREPLEVHGLGEQKTRPDMVQHALGLVGLAPVTAQRFPHQLSGGQRQRVAVARALAVQPRLILADEPLSALDVSVQAQVSNLLLDLKRDLGLAFLLVAHNLAAVRRLSDQVAVMYRGRIVEIGPADSIYENPLHPYTVSLMSAVPVPDPSRESSRERLVVADDPEREDARGREPGDGCPYRTYCWLYSVLGRPERCALERPALTIDNEPDHQSACHFAGALPDRNERSRVLQRVGVS